MTGERSGTDKVLAGTERQWPLRFDAVLAERALDDCARAWASFAYQEAAVLLERHVGSPFAGAPALPDELRERIAHIHALSLAFAAWDRFEHEEALRLLSGLPDTFPLHLAALRALPPATMRGPTSSISPISGATPVAAASGAASTTRSPAAIGSSRRPRSGSLSSATSCRPGPAGPGVAAEARKEWAAGLADDATINLPLEKTWRLLKDLEGARPEAERAAVVADLFAARSSRTLFEDMRGWLGRRNR